MSKDTGNGHDPQPTPPAMEAPAAPMAAPVTVPHHVNWWTEMNRASKVVVMLTGFLVFWSMIGENVTSCIDKAVNEKKESAKIVALEAADKELASEIDAVELEQVEVKQKIANFEANFAIQTAEMGEARQDISEINEDVKQIQRDIQQMLVLMAERNNP